MTPDGFALAATIILIFPMLYFQLVTPTFLLAKLTDPTVTWLLRGLFNTHFMIVSVGCAIGTVAFTVAGRPVVAVLFALIAGFAVWMRRWFRQHIDAELSARDAGDADAIRRLRRLHWGGMLCNAVQLGVVIATVPLVFGTAA